MEPKIAHRCTACGASIRADEQFCPQCGAEVNKPEVDESLNNVTAKPDTVGSAKGKRAKRGSTAPTQPFSPEKLPLLMDQPLVDEVVSEPHVDADADALAAQAKANSDTGQSKRQRVKDAAREIVDENVRPRVEKLRHASSVVLEEAAAIDPSLRFILIAVFLFIVFIVMLAISFVR